MKLEPNVNGSPVVTPLKISAALGGQAKVEPAITDTPKTDNEDDYDQYPDADEDLDDGGGSCAKNENGSEFSIESKSFGKAEPIDNETGETEESSSATGKKKSVRKKRSLNWEEGERVSSHASICVFYVKFAPKMHHLNDTDQPTTNHFHTVCNEHAYITIYVYERLNEVSVKCVQVIGRGYCLFNYSLG